MGLAAVATATLTVGGHQHKHPGHASKSLRATKEVKKGHFGATEIANYPSEGELKMEKLVYPPSKEFVRDYER